MTTPLILLGFGGNVVDIQCPRTISGLRIPPERFVTLVHRSSYLSRRARLGCGVPVYPQRSISNNAVLGNHMVVL